MTIESFIKPCMSTQRRYGIGERISTTPDELIEMLNERIEWVKEHKRSVDKYLRKRGGPNWVRVIDGSRADSAT